MWSQTYKLTATVNETVLRGKETYQKKVKKHFRRLKSGVSIKTESHFVAPVAWNSLCRLGWPWTHRYWPASCFLSAEIKDVPHLPLQQAECSSVMDMSGKCSEAGSMSPSYHLTALLLHLRMLSAKEQEDDPSKSTRMGSAVPFLSSVEQFWGVLTTVS